MSSVQVLQLSDLHLFATPEMELRGCNLRQSFTSVLSSVRQKHADFDLLVLTGDLAHDECEPTYLVLRELLGDWVERCRLIPGNHDNRQAIRSVFPELVPPDGVLTFSYETPNWRFVGLDTHVDNYVPGQLSNEQLEWLKSEVQEADKRNVALFMHHPPLAVGTEWLDKIGLECPEPLMELIGASANVRICCCGHVHHPTDQMIDHCRFLTAPSTGAQFVPQQPKTCIDNSTPPGYRVIDFQDGGFDTFVERITVSQ